MPLASSSVNGVNVRIPNHWFGFLVPGLVGGVDGKKWACALLLLLRMRMVKVKDGKGKFYLR